MLWLVGQIIDHSNPQEEVQNWFPGDDLFTPSERRRGIPIGNQTSQFFANVYLDPLDHFVKDRLGIKGYVRYVDDFLVFSDDKSYLADVREQIKEFLVRLRLRLHPKKNVIFPVSEGIRFLGYRVFPTHRLLAKENVRRFRRRVRTMQQEYAGGAGFLRGNLPAAHELDRPRPASEHLPAALPSFRYNPLPEGDGRVAVCCVAARSTIKRRTSALPTATTTCRRTVTTISVSVRRVPCLARIRRHSSCGACQGAKSRSSSRVGPSLDGSAK